MPRVYIDPEGRPICADCAQRPLAAEGTYTPLADDVQITAPCWGCGERLEGDGLVALRAAGVDVVTDERVPPGRVAVMPGQARQAARGRLDVRLPAPLLDQLKAHAAREGVSMTAVLERALTRELQLLDAEQRASA